jgi:TRAP-type C4-dicarboxylate transport system permease small subunit
MIQQFKKALESTSHGALVLGTIFMLGIGAITILNVILRLFNVAMTGFIESIELMTIVATLGAMVFAAFEKTQIAIDVIIGRLSSQNRKRFETLAVAASLIFWALVGWSTFDWIRRGAYAAITDVLRIPMWPFEVIWLLSLFFFVLVYLVELLLIKSDKI